MQISAVIACGVWGSPVRAQGPAARPNGAVVTVLRPYGFEPATVRIAAGRTQFLVFNRTGLTQVSLRIEREAGAALQTVHAEQVTRYHKHGWGPVLELTPGRYRIVEANHPRLVCQITVR